MRALTQIRAASDGSRPRAQRFSEQRRRNSLHAYGWLALALVVLLGTGAVIGYLLGARSDSPRAAPAQEMRSLERRLSGRIAEGLEVMARRVDDLRAQASLRRSPRRESRAGAKSGRRARSKAKGRKGQAEGKGARGRTKVIASMDGSGPESTDSFSARAPWQIKWEGEDVFVFVNRAKDGSLVRGDGGRGSGSFVVREGGRFVMDVLAHGDWAIKVVGR